MRRGIALAGVFLAVAACRFDASGQPLGDDGGQPVDGNDIGQDGGDVDAAPGDAGPCGADIWVEMSVNGQPTPLGDGEPYAHVLVGDTVTLSASGSCSADGSLLYNWQISPIDGTRETALPHTQAETITVYPMNVDAYQVTLMIADSNGRDASMDVFAFRAHGWNDISGITNVNDVDVGEGMLWVAHGGGADRLPLANPTSFVDIAAEVDPGSDPPLENKASSVFFGPADLVWIGHTDARAGVWRLDYDQIPPRSTFHPYDTILNVVNATVYDIGPHTTGVAVATSDGLVMALDNVLFTDTFVPPDMEMRAVATGDGQRWAGASRLYDLDAGGTSTDPFGDAADSKIRNLAIDVANDELWVASEDLGIARVDNTTGAVIATYDDVNTIPLTTDKLRYAAIETTGPFAGDAWVATDKGVARYKRDRDTWIIMGNGFGLNGHNDVRSVVVDEADGRRVIYAGTSNGVVYIRAP
jgi:hypothetical protein